jgi:hypothetical protein
MSVASDIASRNLLRAAGALVSAALLFSQPSRGVTYTTREFSDARGIATPRYRVAQEKGVTVVLLYAGRRPTGGYSIVVSGVENKRGGCAVRYRIDAPLPDAMVSQVVTYPATVVRIRPQCESVSVNPAIPEDRGR